MVFVSHSLVYFTIEVLYTEHLKIYNSIVRQNAVLKKWSIFEKVPCTLEKNVYFASLGLKALYISVKSISSRVLLSDTISFLIFCLETCPFLTVGC